MINFTEILACDGTTVYELADQAMSFKTSGCLQIFLAFDGMLLLRLNDFEYGINASQEIQYENDDPQFEMVLKLRRYPKGHWVIKLNQHADQVFSCLNQKCYLKKKSTSASKYSSYSSEDNEKAQMEVKKSYVKKQKRKSYDMDEQDEKIQQKQSKPITAGSVLIGASKGLGWGLKMAGKALSFGFEAAGGLASKAVKPAADRVQVSENAKANIDLAKKTSKSVLTFTATQVSNLFNFGKETVSNIGERFEKSEKGQELQQNPNYDKVKSGAATGVKVAANVYDGVVSAVYEVGSGISKGTSKIIGKKYGDEAGQAADDMFEGAGNIVKISRIPQDEVAKSFKE